MLSRLRSPTLSKVFERKVDTNKEGDKGLLRLPDSTRLIHRTCAVELLIFFMEQAKKMPMTLLADEACADLEAFVKSYVGLDEELEKHAAILFRGFGVSTVEKFNSFIRCFNTDPIPYMFRSSPRHLVSDKVYVSTTYPENRTINMHSESSYSFAWGRRIFFCCIKAPLENGETPIADNRRVLRRLSGTLVSKFEKLGVLYQRNLSTEIGMSWEEVFQTSDAEVVKKVCAQNNIQYKFHSADNLILKWRKPAIYFHPSTKEKIWFNHAFFFNRFSLLEEMGMPSDDTSLDDFLPSETFFGDGSKISYFEYSEIKNAYESEKAVFPWQEGDVLMLDNMLAAHGRNPYKGDRQIVVSIIEPYYSQNL